MARQDGNDARRKLVVSGIERKVDVNLFIVSFWKIKTGRVPACSEPRIGLRFASQISPRLTIMECPRQSGLSRNPLCPRQRVPDHPLQSWHKELQAVPHRLLLFRQAKRRDG